MTPFELALLGELHQAAAAGLGLLGVGAGLGVEQGQAGDALGRAAQDLERDVAAHGQADEREAGGGGGEDLGGEAGDGVGTGEVADQDVAAGLQCRELGGIEPVVAEQSRQEDDGVGHGFPHYRQPAPRTLTLAPEPRYEPRRATSG